MTLLPKLINSTVYQNYILYITMLLVNERTGYFDYFLPHLISYIPPFVSPTNLCTTPSVSVFY